MAQALGYHFLIPLSCWSFRLSLLLQVPLRESGRSTCCFNMAPKATALADPNAPDAITTWIRRHCSGDAVKRKERDCAIRTPEERAAIRDANMERMHAEYQLSKDHALFNTRAAVQLEKDTFLAKQLNMAYAPPSDAPSASELHTTQVRDQQAAKDAGAARRKAKKDLEQAIKLSKQQAVHDEELGHQSPRGDEEEAAEKKAAEKKKAAAKEKAATKKPKGKKERAK